MAAIITLTTDFVRYDEPVPVYVNNLDTGFRAWGTTSSGAQVISINDPSTYPKLAITACSSAINIDKYRFVCYPEGRFMKEVGKCKHTA